MYHCTTTVLLLVNDYMLLILCSISCVSKPLCVTVRTTTSTSVSVTVTVLVLGLLLHYSLTLSLTHRIYHYVIFININNNNNKHAQRYFMNAVHTPASQALMTWTMRMHKCRLGRTKKVPYGLSLFFFSRG